MKISCPIGGQRFKATFVSSLWIQGQRLDLKPILVPGAAPILPIVCPENGFVTFKDKLSDEEISKLTPIVLSDDHQRRRAGNTTQFMVAYINERLGADDEGIANRYLAASWEAEEIPNPQLVERYRSLALDKLQLAVRRDQRWEIVLLAAELERLLGRFDAAVARLAAVPPGALNEGQSMALEQVLKHARDRNAEPQPFAPNYEWVDGLQTTTLLSSHAASRLWG